MTTTKTTTNGAPAPIGKGLATYMGVALALVQYAGAVAAFVNSRHDPAAFELVATATATAITTIGGRMYQAGKAITAAGSNGSSS